MAEYLESYFGISKVDSYALAWSGVFDANVFQVASLEQSFQLGPNGIFVLV